MSLFGPLRLCRICRKGGAAFWAGHTGPYHFSCASMELDRRVATLPPALGEYGLAAVPVPAVVES